MTVERQLDPEALGDHIDRLYRAARGACAAPARRPRTSCRRRSCGSSAAAVPALRGRPRLSVAGAAQHVLQPASRRGRRPQTQPPARRSRLIEDRSAAQPEARLESERGFTPRSRGSPDDFRDALVAIDLVGLSYREAARRSGSARRRSRRACTAPASGSRASSSVRSAGTLPARPASRSGRQLIEALIAAPALGVQDGKPAACAAPPPGHGQHVTFRVSAAT